MTRYGLERMIPVFDDDTEWFAEAACRGASLAEFFPERGRPTGTAKMLCFNCPVRIDCLEYALRNQIRFGIWGGTSERERRRLRARRRVA